MVPESPRTRQNTTTDVIDVMGPPDEPGTEMSEEARVWRVYVKETDKWDQEMVDGRNKSLDVLLIFAALFSAISTAFVIESLGDLKPDPAESSAQTLLVVSQQLNAIAHGQLASDASSALGLNGSAFLPPRAAVVVNILWFLSLSLSVAVSLVAMLAKEWCYKFMSSRSGPTYEQARRRQQRWDGIEKWKMQEILMYLPGLMHLALVLFAAGLCVYLWNIHISVAIPVIVITGAATSIYICATVLPTIDPYCPFSTPAVDVVAGGKTVTLGMLRSIKTYTKSSWDLVKNNVWQFLRRHVDPLAHAIDTLEQALEVFESFRGPSDDDLYQAYNNTTISMDRVTSRMLSWLIKNCEDSRSVDMALQAISGASKTLPKSPLVRCQTARLIVVRLVACVKRDRDANPVPVGEPLLLSTALKYCRAYSVLMLGASKEDVLIGLGENNEYDHKYVHKWIHKMYFNIIYQALGEKNNLNMLAVAVATAVPFGWLYPSENLDKLLALVVLLLRRNFESSNTTLPASMLSSLVESIASCWTTTNAEGDPDEAFYGVSTTLTSCFSGSFLVLLTEIVLVYHDTYPEIASSAAIALAMIGVATRGNSLLQPDETSQKGAIQVFNHYQNHTPDKEATLKLFMFGFFSLLPGVRPNLLEAELIVMGERFDKLMNAIACIKAKKTSREHLVPREIDSIYKFSVDWISASTVTLACNYLESFLGDKSSGPEAVALFSLLPLLINPCSEPVESRPRLYVIALTTLCYAESSKSQDVCMQFVDNQPVPEHLLELIDSADGTHLLETLCSALIENIRPAASIVILHFKLLLAVVVSSLEGTTARRKAALQPLLAYRDRFTELKAPRPLSVKKLLSHIGECVDHGEASNTMVSGMQCVVDFCEAGLVTESSATAGEETTDGEIRARLQELKERLRHCSAKLRSSREANTESAEDKHNRDWVTQLLGTSMAAFG